MLTGFFLMVRISLAWGLVVFIAMVILAQFVFRVNTIAGGLEFLPLIAGILAMAMVFSHISRVRLITMDVNAQTLSNRQRRLMTLAMEAETAFALLEAVLKEFPGVVEVASSADSLQIRAKLRQLHPYHHTALAQMSGFEWLGSGQHQILATVTPGVGGCELMLICEPDRAAWVDSFLVDHGTNLEIAEALVRAISQRAYRS